MTMMMTKTNISSSSRPHTRHRSTSMTLTTTIAPTHHTTNTATITMHADTPQHRSAKTETARHCAEMDVCVCVSVRGDECEGEREVSECLNGCRCHLRNHSRGVNYCPPSLKLTAKLRRRSTADGPFDFYPFFVKRHRPPSSSAPTQHQHQHQHQQQQQGASSDGRGRTGGEEPRPRRLRERTAIDYREPKLNTKLRKGGQMSQMDGWMNGWTCVS